MASTTTEKSEAARRRKPAAAGRDELVERFLELRPVVQKRFSAELEQDLREHLQHVTIHQLTALGRLRQHSLTMRELAAELGVGESAATAVTDRLVRQGLVERRDDPHDRRVVRLELSPAGSTLVERLHESASRKSAAMLEVLSDTQLAWFVDILETLSRALVAHSHSCAGACSPHGSGSPQSPTHPGASS